MAGTGLFTVTVAEPDNELSWVEVAVMVAVPRAAGVNIPEEVMEPSVAAQLTVAL
jgi:hypothetical protein